MAIQSTIMLNNGTVIPQVGLGVFQTPDGDTTVNAVQTALENGYRHIDTAMIYHNEASVGEGIRRAGVPRSDFFLTTKLWNDDIRARRGKDAFQESLDRLGVDYVDLYLNGDIPYLCDAETAALGKLDIESKKLNLKGLMQDWVEYTKSLCMENDLMAHQVRKKGKSLKDCMATLLVYSFQRRISIDKEIVKAAKITANRVDFGTPGMGEAKRLIREYYLGGTGR